jgi:Spy/CpxP family protein refolding chaperone
MSRLTIALLISLVAAPVGAGVETPYAGQERQSIKALPGDRIQDYLNGRGMGYARAAELNHFPGPRHVLDLAAELHLSDDQAARSGAIFESMQSRAAALGRLLVDRERTLDAQFAAGSIDSGTLDALVREIAAIEARIRYVHLHAHLEQRALLTEHQVHLYDRLRGYANADGGAGHVH